MVLENIFSKRYAGSTDTKVNDDIVFFQKVASNQIGDTEKYVYTIDAADLINQKFSISSPFTRAFLLLLAQHNPLNLTNGNRIDLGRALSQYNSKNTITYSQKRFLRSINFRRKKSTLYVIFVFTGWSNKK